MKPVVAAAFAAGVEPFPVYYESPSRWYVPRFWGVQNCGVPDGDARQPGLPLRPELKFAKTLRAEQLPIVEAFRTGVAGGDVASASTVTRSGSTDGGGFLDAFNGLLCVPCGYGKTFMGIWLACQMKRRFLIVVHQEFLMEQWKGELEAAVPGIRVGKLQGPKAQLGPEYDCCICMLQTVASRDWPLDTFAGFGFTLFDECHHLGAEHFSRALMSIQTMNMLDCRGEVSRPKLCNQLADYAPRTKLICDELSAALAEGRKLLVLSDRRGHLEEFEKEFRARGYTSMGYYVGGMKAAARDTSAKCQIVLATFTLAAEGMNVRDLNTVALVTPKSRIEQAVGRIFRLKKEERTFAPIIYDVRDTHDVLLGQYRKRLQFYEQCGYQLTMKGPGDTDYKPLKTRRTRAAPLQAAIGGAGTGGDESDSEDECVSSYKKEETVPSTPMFRMAAPVAAKKA
jgi:superfamily II DNA or RNA helicase